MLWGRWANGPQFQPAGFASLLGLPPVPRTQCAAFYEGSVMKFCQCGCGEAVNEKRSFVNKEHQLRWMSAGGAKELNGLQRSHARARQQSEVKSKD